MHLTELTEFLNFLLKKFEDAIAEKGYPIFHHALGKQEEVWELNELLQIIFLNEVLKKKTEP